MTLAAHYFPNRIHIAMELLDAVTQFPDVDELGSTFSLLTHIIHSSPNIHILSVTSKADDSVCICNTHMFMNF